MCDKCVGGRGWSVFYTPGYLKLEAITEEDGLRFENELLGLMWVISMAGNTGVIGKDRQTLC
jgi:hypothetical protein